MLLRLRVKHFRCFTEAELALHPSITLLGGRNAQGKTSLLEAICVLFRLQSPRTSTRGELIQIGAKASVIEGDLPGLKLRHAQNAAARRLAINEAPCRQVGEYLQAAPLVVWMDHADMNMLRGGAEHRRRFLDFAASQLFPSYLTALRGYERALRSRNFLLKRDARIDWRQVDAYTLQLQSHGQVLMDCRADLVTRLEPHVSASHHRLSGMAEAARVSYAPGLVEGTLVEYLSQHRHVEEKNRVTCAGPHRDDLKVYINDLDAGAYASEGQQRTASLALKLAQAEVLKAGRGQAPILLCDDVFGELDRNRRRAFLASLPPDSQKVITSTSFDWAEELGLAGDEWVVEAGTVQRR